MRINHMGLSPILVRKTLKQCFLVNDAIALTLIRTLYLIRVMFMCIRKA